MTRKIEILGVGIDVMSSRDVIGCFERYIRNGSAHAIYIVNCHTLNLACKDAAYRSMLNSGDLVLNDGLGISLAAYLKGRSFKENLVGTDLVPKLLASANSKGYGIFLLGGPAGAASRSAHYLQGAFPKIRIAGVHHGYFGSEANARVIEKINSARPHLLLVGMGNPRQEQWIHRNLHAIKVPAAVGVGGLFKYYSGKMKRAPRWMRQASLEWLYLLGAAPRRSWRRYLLGHPLFVARALKSTCLRSMLSR